MKSRAEFRSESKMLFFNGNLIRAFLFSDYSIAPHNHDFYEMNIVLRGTGKHMIESSFLEVRSGDVFVIPPNTVHSYSDTHKLDVYHVLFHPDFIAQNSAETTSVPGFVQLVEIEPYLRQHFSEAMFLHLSPNELLQLESELKFIEDGNDYNNIMKNHAAWKIVYWLSHLLNKQLCSAEKKRQSKYEQAILSTLEYIHTNFGEKITINSLCRRVFLSRSTFLRSFTDMCGCPPMEYLHKYRCKKALEMIKSSNVSKTEAAHICGFYDLSHMERMLNREKNNSA